ncbi:MAG: PcfJ domain-containing protein [Treponema sp.]|nr:PcfJ domain-containing protein [Treponema sp.]
MIYTYDYSARAWLPSKTAQEVPGSGRKKLILQSDERTQAFCPECRSWQTYQTGSDSVYFACGHKSQGMLTPSQTGVISRIIIRHNAPLHETFLALELSSIRAVGLCPIQEDGFLHWLINMKTGVIKKEFSDHFSTLKISLPLEIAFILQRLFTRESLAVFGKAYKNTMRHIGLESLFAFVTCPPCPQIVALKPFLGDIYKPLIRRTTQNPYREVCTALHIHPPKKVQKLFAKEPEVLAEYIILRTIGFTDDNAMQLFYNHPDECRRYFQNIRLKMSAVMHGSAPVLTDLKDTREKSHRQARPADGAFVLEAIAEWVEASNRRNSQIVTARRLLKAMETPENEFIDTIHMVRDLQDFLPPDVTSAIEKTCFCHEVHERLIELTHAVWKERLKRRSENRLIPYTAREKALEERVNDLDFSLPADTHSLIDIGSAMHICVGSYDDRAVSQECVIVTASNAKTGNYAACIEIRRQCVVQVKGPCNKHLSLPMQNTIFVWMCRHKLRSDTTDLDSWKLCL